MKILINSPLTRQNRAAKTYSTARFSLLEQFEYLLYLFSLRLTKRNIFRRKTRLIRNKLCRLQTDLISLGCHPLNAHFAQLKQIKCCKNSPQIEPHRVDLIFS
jgi:hypothetical protein